MAAMTSPTSPPPPRPHRRAARQLLLGLVPLLVVGLVLLAALVVRLGDVRGALSDDTGTATATVTAVGTAPDGRGLDVSFTDAEGRQRTGVVELERALDVPVGARLTVRYDPADPADGPARVHTDGDAASAALSDVLFGLVVVLAVLLGTTALTTARLLGRPRLRSRPALRPTATHVVVKQGLLVRSWLEIDTSAGLRWLPVYWAAELDRLTPGARIEVRGDPARERLVLPVLEGAEIWPSGRVRGREPRGELRQAPADPAATDVRLARQARADGVLPFLAPVLGLLWSYVDSTGLLGFLAATALSAGFLFWLPQLLGSDPRAPGRG
jgi:hypothetical protein